MTKQEKITILYENEDILAINKPAGLIVHGDGKERTKGEGKPEPTVVDWILKKYPEIETVGEKIITQNGSVIKRPGIVHRIDRDTSGVLLIAKNQEAFDFLKEKFKKREMKKVYRAFACGTPRDSRGVIEREIRRSKTDFRKWTSYVGRGMSRPAITHFRLLASGAGVSYLELRPQTGRTHQIRVHLSSIGHPIVGDTLYGKGKETAFDFKRVALHAMSLTFKGKGGKEIAIEAPLPDDFIKAEKELLNIAKN